LILAPGVLYKPLLKPNPQINPHPTVIFATRKAGEPEKQFTKREDLLDRVGSLFGLEDRIGRGEKSFYFIYWMKVLQ